MRDGWFFTAVLGEPDDELGERIVAFVVLQEGRVASPQTLCDQVASLLARHKRPRRLLYSGTAAQ
jgi:acyl-CoA synthetase (AMP-forming)/AMP-acid ligase II